MGRFDDHRWLEPDEHIVHQAQATARVQVADSIVRRGFRAHFFLTDRRLVALRTTAVRRRHVLIVNVQRSAIRSSEVVEPLLRLPGRKPLLRLEVEQAGAAALAISIELQDPASWIAALQDGGD